ncbi:MAG: trehalose-phosphatase [Candidatus Marsarchaeota archaeon]|nr:trehalose-phosphatase [Candidatus Marsarchaeota archaeon]
MLSKHLFDCLDSIRDILSNRPRCLAFDIDGTISEIAPTPQQAFVTTACRNSLRALVPYFDVIAAVSGRSADDARAMVAVDGLTYIGNHGLEEWAGGSVLSHCDAEFYKSRIEEALDELAHRLQIAGVLAENKGVTASIHYRGAIQPKVARAAILQAIQEVEAAKTLEVFEGKMVVELRPPVKEAKGSALKRLAEFYKLASVIYLGDDVTDVDAFIMLQKLRAARGLSTLAVAVLGFETPPQVLDHAEVTLNGVSEVERFLLWLTKEAAGKDSPTI